MRKTFFFYYSNTYLHSVNILPIFPLLFSIYFISISTLRGSVLRYLYTLPLTLLFNKHTKSKSSIFPPLLLPVSELISSSDAGKLHIFVSVYCQ